jgi:hypothetical protein
MDLFLSEPSGTRAVERKYSPLLPNFIRGTWGLTSLCHASVRTISTSLFALSFPVFSHQRHRAQQVKDSARVPVSKVTHSTRAFNATSANPSMKACLRVQRSSLAMLFSPAFF